MPSMKENGPRFGGRGPSALDEAGDDVIGGDHVPHVAHEFRRELLVLQARADVAADVALDPHLVPRRGPADGLQFVQLCYNLSDPGMEDLLYESGPVRRFAGLNLSGQLPA